MPPPSLTDDEIIRRQRVLADHGGSLRAAALALGITRSTLCHTLDQAKKRGLVPPAASAAPAEHSPAIDRELQRLRDRNKRLEASLAEIRRDSVEAEDVRKVIFGLSATTPEPPDWLVKTGAAGGVTGVPSLIASDWHLGEVVNSAEVNGVNAYDLTIAEALYPLPKVIALTGLAGAGKSSVASVLMLAHGYRRVRFAGPLKAMLKAIGLGEDEVDGPLKERPCALLGGHTPRHAMQTLGTEWGRAHLGPRFWVGLWQATAYDVLDHGGRVVVDDCRFPDEADAVRSVGGVIWRVTRPGLTAGPHRSERAMSAIRATTIRNAGTLTELAVAVEAALTPEKP